MPIVSSIADGRKIVVEFDQPLIGSVTGNEASFTATFDEYDKVPDGSVFRATRKAILVEDYNGVNEFIDFSKGTFANTTIRGDGVELQSVDGKPELRDFLNTTSGMTAVRNGSKQDDGVDTVTGVDWFIFNGVTASSIYVSGNSFVGFGANAEHLKICQRDGAMYYLYRQEGTIGATKFLKLRWQGYTRYNSTSASYALTWELFLFSDGGMYLNLITVPTDSGYLGESKLICGSSTYSFTVTASKPVAYSFLKPSNGKYFMTADEKYFVTADEAYFMTADEEPMVASADGYIVSNEIYPVYTDLVPSGSAEFTNDSASKIAKVKHSLIEWEAVVPYGTTLKIYSKVTGGSYTECISGEPIAGVNPGYNLSGKTLYFKLEISTTEQFITPSLKKLKIILGDSTYDNKILIGFDAGVQKSIQRAIGNITICYNGTGTLRSLGGPVLAFEKEFIPVGLDHKNNPHNPEHIEVNIQASAVLKRVYYSDYKLNDENITVSIAATGALIKIDDI